MAHAQAVDGQEQAGSGTVAAGTCSDAVPRGLPDHGDLDALCVVLGQPTVAAQPAAARVLLGAAATRVVTEPTNL